MNAIRKLWQSMNGLAAALDRLTGLAHQAGDALEERLPADERPALPSNGDGQRIVRPRK
ncbi:MAG TPA: hypothetical protein VGX70_08145 [Gemmataceae bacterium]|jgi:hypothetical protein|nr:hypothetical protein [Gemmataceae bacterium]